MTLFATSMLAAVGTPTERALAERIEEGLLLMGVGMGVVFCALVVIGVLIWLMSTAIRRMEERQERILAAQAAAAEAAKAAQTKAAQAAQSAPLATPARGGTAYPQAAGVDNTATGAGSGIDQRTLALITAAVAATVGSARIRRVTRLRMSQRTPMVSAWTDAGRSGLHSHNVRR